MHRHLDTEALLDVLDTVVLVDSLGVPYFDAVHLPGAVNIPPHRVSQLASALLPDKDAHIVVYASGRASSNAEIVSEQLTALGYSHVFVYADGTEGWLAAGLSVESGLHASDE